MFAISKSALVSFLHLKQRSTCAYDSFSFRENSNPPSFCDCKYGWDGKSKFIGEENGCPELRLAHAIFSAMTDEEYKNLLERAGCHL